jgi:hypothetical protein
VKGRTVIMIVVLLDPLALLAVIVWVTFVCVAVGVPLIAQFVGLMVSPVGNAGLAEQDVGVPVRVGVMFTALPA